MKLYLHIGTEKTGTTFLQNFLYKNFNELSRQGVFLSRVLSRPNNRSLVHYFSNRKDDFWLRNGLKSIEDKERYYSGFLDRLREEIETAASDHEAMIISSEHFHSRLFEASEVAALHDYLKDIFTEIRVICYLREQSAVRKSLYSTALKGRGTNRLSSFMSDQSSNSKYYDYYELACRWRDAFGPSALRFRTYDRDAFIDGDLRLDFLSILDEPIDASALNFEAPSANESLSYLQAAAYRAINENCPRFMEAGGFNPVNVALKRAASQAKQIDHGEIFDPNQAAFHAQFAEGNEALFREFIPDGPKFSEPVVADVSHDEKRFSLEDVSRMIDDVFAQVAKTVDSAFLSDGDADFLKDVALKYEERGTLSSRDAIGLMRLAARARPSGTVIRQKLEKWTGAASAK